ncbi:MAG: LCP family protein [Syntrophomonadaceae bacterium]|nr:LCP family protein [Syntrophomonadaceae bacterium]
MSWFSSLKRGLLCALVFATTFGIGTLIGGQFLSDQSIETKVSDGKTINILFMGIDARDAKSNSRSDTIILASIDSKTKKVVMVSIPRDTHIRDAKGNSGKINAVNEADGPDAACKEVSNLMGIQIKHYVITNFAGFEKIVDTLGGVHIDVESDMYHADPVNPELEINIHKGYQYLNGSQALSYVRYRGGLTADIGRTQRQQKFIKALLAEILQTKTIAKLPELIPAIQNNIRTNVPISDLIYLAQIAGNFNDPDKIIVQTLPGYPYTDPSSGASYWEVSKPVSNGIITGLLSGKTYAVITDPPSWIKKEQNFRPIPPQEVSEVNKNQKEINTVKKDNSTEANNSEEGTDKSSTAETIVPGNTVSPPVNTTPNTTAPAPAYGTAKAGTNNTITLADGSNVNDNYYNGKKIRITGGTGAGQVRFICGYVGSTNIATVSAVLVINPDSTSTYAIDEKLVNGDTPAPGDKQNGTSNKGNKGDGSPITLWN